MSRRTALRKGGAVSSAGRDSARAPEAPRPVELSVVIPCLNEEDTLESCIEKAWAALRSAGISGEIVVADNGSSDRSVEIAESLGARVVVATAKGYGSALMAGIAASRGRYVVMGDADDSYDFGEIPKFVEKLRMGFDLVQGCRLRTGGGRVLPGAMPLLHRWWGNPMFSRMARSWFGAPIHDVHCGMRGFARDLPERLGQQCTGMEFASEMIIKAALAGTSMSEVPLTLYPDGRRTHAAHLRTFQDGWRHLRFYLVYSPRWLFLVPGFLLILAGLAGYALAMPQLTWGGIVFDVHTLLFASLAIVAGYQSVLFAVFTKVFAISQGLLPTDRRMERLFARVNLERGLAAGAAAALAGLFLLGLAVNDWREVGFGPLVYTHTMRRVIPGMTLFMIGFQTVLSSFFLSILGLKRR